MKTDPEEEFEGEEVARELDEIAPVLAPLLHLWRTKRADRVLPARADFVFEDFVPWLGFLHLIEVEPADFLFRIFGTRAAERLGRDFTGRRLSETAAASPVLAEKAFAGYRAAIAARAPLFRSTAKTTYRSQTYSWSRLILPMGEGARVTHLLVAVAYDK
jgi:hypothetical protein